MALECEDVDSREVVVSVGFRRIAECHRRPTDQLAGAHARWRLRRETCMGEDYA
jgi:hypothetical protein